MTNITFTTTGATGATFAGLPGGVTGNWSGNVVTISGTPTASGAFNYTVTLTGGCGNITATGIITVTANNTITLTSAAGTNAQTLCLSSAITNITYSTTGATGATFSGLPAGVTGNWAANVVTISGTPTASGTFNYTVTLTGGCGSVTAGGSITISTPPPTTGVTICQGGSGSLTSSAACAPSTPGTAGPNYAGAGASNNGTGTLAWTGPGNIFANDGVSATASVSSGNTTTTTQYLQATNFGFAIPANANITGIQVSMNRFGSASAGTNNVQDNIVSLIKGGTITGNDNSLAGNWSATNTFVANYGTTTDLWGTTWTPAQINAANFGVALSVFIRRSSGTVMASVDYVTITVSYSIPGSLNWYTVSSGGTAIGNGSPFNPVGVAGSGLPNTNTPGTYIFYAECAAAPGCRTATNFVINPGPTITGNLTICTSGSTTTQLTGSGTPAASAPWVSGTTSVATVNNTGLVTGVGAGTSVITYKDNNGCTATATVTVIQPTITGTTTFCIGTTTQLTGSQTADPTTPWASSNTAVATVNNTGLVTAVAPGTSVITYKNSTGCTATTTVTVNDNATIVLTSAPATTSQAVCINTAITPITYLIGGGGTGATVSGLPTGVTGSYNAGTKVFTISGSPTVSAGSPYSYTVTTTGPCIKPSLGGTVSVTPNSTLTLTSAAATTSQTVCTNTPIVNITYSVGGSGTGANVTGLPAGVTGAYNSGTKIFTISGTPTATGTFNYSVTTTGPCANPSLGGTITTLAVPTGTFSASETSGIANNDNIICAGATVTFTAPSGYGAYTFYVNGVKVQGPNTSNTYSNSTLSNGDQVTVDVANAVNCGTTFGPITITVNPLPTPTLVADKNPVCAGDLVTFTATGGTNYNFKVNGSSVQSGASATYTTTTLANNDAVTVDATNANGCIGTSLAVFMTVNPLPTGTLTASPATICAGDNVTFTATAGAATYEFKVDGVTVQGPSATNTYSTTALTNGQVVTVIATSAANPVPKLLILF